MIVNCAGGDASCRGCSRLQSFSSQCFVWLVTILFVCASLRDACVLCAIRLIAVAAKLQSGDVIPPVDEAAQLAVVPEPGAESDGDGDYDAPPPPPPMPSGGGHGGYQAPPPPPRYMVKGAAGGGGPALGSG